MQATQSRQSIGFSILTTLVLLALYIVAANLIEPPTGEISLILLGLFLAVIPAVIWLVFFYQRDHVEPEPKRMVARVFLFGGLAAAAVSIPLTRAFYAQAINPMSTFLARLVVTTLSVSLLQEVLKLAMVRYVVLGTDEFDEHPDGIVYGLASGLGFATVLNINYVLSAGGVLPLAGAIFAANNALVHGALGAFTGYYVGRVKLDGMKTNWLATGLGIATLASGLYLTISREVTSGGLSFNPAMGLIVSGGLALVIGALLLNIFQQAHEHAAGTLTTVAQQAKARSLDMPWDIAPRYDTVLLTALIVALLVGFGVGLMVNNQTVDFASEQRPFTLSYPASWGAEEKNDGDLSVVNLASGDTFNPLVEVTSNKVAAGSAMDQLLTERSLTLEAQSDFFKEESRGNGPTVGGQPTEQLFYTYVTQTDSGPVVVRGVDTLLLFDEKLYTFRFVAEANTFAEHLDAYNRLLSTVAFN